LRMSRSVAVLLSSFLPVSPPPPSTLFPYTPLFRSAIVTAAEQAAAVGREGQALHRGAMALQDRPSEALLRIPQPDGVGCEAGPRSEEHTSELQSRVDLVCRLLLDKKKKKEQEQQDA